MVGWKANSPATTEAKGGLREQGYSNNQPIKVLQVL